MTRAIHPQPGQVWTLNEKHRKVVSVFQSTEGVRVGWQRPDNAWSTSYVQVKTWLKWASKAKLSQRPLI